MKALHISKRRDVISRSQAVCRNLIHKYLFL